MMIYVYLIFIVVFLFLEFVRSTKRGKIYFKEDSEKIKYDNLPPGSMGIPILGETINFFILKAEFFRQKRKKYGPVFRTHLFGKPTIRVSGRENIRKIILGENKIVQSSYPASVRQLIGDNSISMSQGEQHKSRKFQLMKFLSPEFLDMHVPSFSELIQDTLEKWCSKPSVDIYTESRFLFLELAAKYLVSVDINAEDKRSMKLYYQQFTDNLFSLPVNIPGFGFHTALKAKCKLKNMFRTIVKSGGKSVSKFPSVLEAYGANLDNQTEIDEDFLDAIVELLWNASETVSSVAFSVVYLLARHPAVLRRVKLELIENGFVKEDMNNNTISETKSTSNKNIHDLQFTECVVKETLRLMPPIGGAYRTALQSFEIEGYTIPKDWTVVFGIRDTHENDDFLPDPMEFNPDRWLSGDQTDKISYFPFGGGARVCPGKNFAKIVLQVFTVELCRQCNWKLLEEHPELVYFPTPRPKNNLQVCFFDKTATF